MTELVHRTQTQVLTKVLWHSAGIGFAIARRLAVRGAKVYMAARSEIKTQKAIERLHEEKLGLLPDQLLWLPLDLSDPKSVVRAVTDLKASESRLDILGTMTPIARRCHSVAPRLIGYVRSEQCWYWNERARSERCRLGTSHGCVVCLHS